MIEYSLKLGSMTQKAALLLLLALVSTNIIATYILGIGLIWLWDAIIAAFGLVLILSAFPAVFRDAHVRLDMFWSKYTSRQKIWVETLGYFFFMVPLFLFLIYAGLPSVIRSWADLETFGNAGGLHGKFIFKSLIPFLGLSMIVSGGFRVMRLWRDVKTGKF